MNDRLRLYSGLVMLVYVVGHLMNHALGLVSIEAMNAGLAITVAPWQTWLGTTLLVGAALVHIVTALWSLYARQTLRLPRWQLWQTILGLLVPLMLAGHIFGTRMLEEFRATEVDYTSELVVLWVLRPDFGAMQSLTLVIVWLHAWLGLDGWLRLKPWYARWQGLARALALLLPALALAGYVAGGMQARRLAETEGWVGEVFAEGNGSPEDLPWVIDRMTVMMLVFVGIYLLVFAARWLRALAQSRVKHPRLYYEDNKEFEMLPGMSVLETLRAAAIAHPSVCGGNGRCSTCRVHIDRGGDWLPTPSAEEAKVLERISAPSSVRLACQLRPDHDLAVSPLLPATATAADAWQRGGGRRSEEQPVAVLFADLRGFTRFAESRLPFDVVFVLNRYRASMAEAIEEAGGEVNEFVGDGIMALFGLDGDAESGCRDAMRAAQLMGERLDRLNEMLGAELEEPLRIGIGIHAGAAIVGEMGYDKLLGITVVGDVVNTASRLEGMTKDFKARLVVSEDAVRLAGLDGDAAPRHEVEVRGREAPMTVRVFSPNGGQP